MHLALYVYQHHISSNWLHVLDEWPYVTWSRGTSRMSGISIFNYRLREVTNLYVLHCFWTWLKECSYLRDWDGVWIKMWHFKWTEKVNFKSQILVHEYWTILKHFGVPVLFASGCHQHVLRNVNILFADNTGTPEMFQYSPILGRSSIWDLKYTFSKWTSDLQCKIKIEYCWHVTHFRWLYHICDLSHTWDRTIKPIPSHVNGSSVAWWSVSVPHTL